ncbi:hypothetical protein CsSME_00044588 [Camellia sinensis var. sinensis]
MITTLFFFTAGGTNPRKRGREITATTSPFNPCFSIQSQSPQLIDLTQLHTHQIQPPNVVSTGLRLAFEDQQQQQLQPQQQQQQQQRTLSPQSSVLSSLLSEDFATQIRQQRDEIQQFLQAQVLISLSRKWILRIFRSFMLCLVGRFGEGFEK